MGEDRTPLIFDPLMAKTRLRSGRQEESSLSVHIGVHKLTNLALTSAGGHSTGGI
jgi:hypothetical protein